jgi:serine/threonine protein phosphatase 1
MRFARFITFHNTHSGRLFVVGDIHGCIKELDTLVNYLKKEQGITSADTIIFIGDYIDRGPYSNLVIQFLIDFQKEHVNTFFLKGNHEDILLDYLGLKGSLGGSYLLNGGEQCLMSYGFTRATPAAEIIESLPHGHLAFLIDLLDGVLIGDYIFVHAGLNPSLTLDVQVTDDIFWIRNEFILRNHQFGKTVVFGHTPHREVVVDLPYKLGVDTGLVFGNKLTCLELHSMSSYQVFRGEKEVVVRNLNK